MGRHLSRGRQPPGAASEQGIGGQEGRQLELVDAASATLRLWQALRPGLVVHCCQCAQASSCMLQRACAGGCRHPTSTARERWQSPPACLSPATHRRRRCCMRLPGGTAPRSWRPHSPGTCRQLGGRMVGRVEGHEGAAAGLLSRRTSHARRPAENRHSRAGGLSHSAPWGCAHGLVPWLFTAVCGPAAPHQAFSFGKRLGSLQLLGRRGSTTGRGASGLAKSRPAKFITDGVHLQGQRRDGSRWSAAGGR